MSTTNRLSTATTNAAEALARIDSTLDQLYAAASIVIETVADFEALEAAPLHHRAAALTAIDRFIDRLEKRRAAEAPKPEPEQAEEEEESEIYLRFTYGKYKTPYNQCDPDDEEYMRLYRHSQELRAADEARMAAEAAASPSSTNTSPASAAQQTHHASAAPSDIDFSAPRVSPEHVRAQITPYADPEPAAKSYSPRSGLGWSDDYSDDDPFPSQTNIPSPVLPMGEGARG